MQIEDVTLAYESQRHRHKRKHSHASIKWTTLTPSRRIARWQILVFYWFSCFRQYVLSFLFTAEWRVRQPRWQHENEHIDFAGVEGFPFILPHAPLPADLTLAQSYKNVIYHHHDRHCEHDPTPSYENEVSINYESEMCTWVFFYSPCSLSVCSRNHSDVVRFVIFFSCALLRSQSKRWIQHSLSMASHRLCHFYCGSRTTCCCCPKPTIHQKRRHIEAFDRELKYS